MLTPSAEPRNFTSTPVECDDVRITQNEFAEC